MVTSIDREETRAKLKPGWRIVRFGDVVRNIQVNVNPEESGLERYVAGEHMETDNLHIKRWGTIGDGYLGPAFHQKFIKGQVLYGSRRTYLRKVAVADFDGICANTTFVLEANEDELLQDLLPFIMQTEAFTQHSIKQSRGSVNPYVIWKDLAWFEFALPPKDEQRRIADILWAAENLREHLEVVLSNLYKLDSSIASMYFENFSVDAEILPCSSLCDEITVGIVVTPSKYYVPSGVPALRSLNVMPNGFMLNDLVHISRAGHAEHTKSQLHEGDVVIVRSGRPGDAAVITKELDGFNCIDLIIARPNKKLRSRYLSRFLNSSVGRKQLERRSAGTAQQHFNVNELKSLNISVPSIDKQDLIIAEFDFIENRIEEVSRHIKRVNNLQNSLRQLFYQKV